WAVRAASATTTSTVPTTSTCTTTSTAATTTTATTSPPATTGTTTTSLAAATTTSMAVSTTAPVTTSTSTTRTPSSTTSTTTVAPEICGNCIDDDHDGLVDLEDPACCGNAGTMQIEHVRIVPHHGRSGLVLRSGLRGMDLAGVRSGKRDVVLQL